MSTFRRIGKVVGGYKVIVSCTNTPMEERVFSTSEECYAFADKYLEKNYFGVPLNIIHHPEGDGVEPEGLNPDSLETIEIEIEIPMNERLKELAEQAKMARHEYIYIGNEYDIERFAELVRQDEREANAKLCENLQLTELVIRDWADGTYDCAKAIRAKDNHEQD